MVSLMMNRSIISCVLLLLGLLTETAYGKKKRTKYGKTPATSREEYLYVWTGSNSVDYVAVVDFNRNSPKYGKILNKVNLTESPTRSSVGNEAHHSLLFTTPQGKTVLVTGGLLSFLNPDNKTDEVFLWDLSNPVQPQLIASYNLPGGCADEINPYRNGVLVSMMCDENAGSPGKIAYVDFETGYTSDWTNSSDLVDFNPHGFDLNPAGGFLFTVDYVLPYTLLPEYAPIVFRNTARRFDLNRSTRALDHVFNVSNNPPPGGMMDFRFIPGTTEGYICGTSSNLLYYVNASSNDTPTFVYDMSLINGGVKLLSAGILRYSQSGKWMFMTYGRRYLVVWNIKHRLSAKPIFIHDFCEQYVTGTESFNCTNNLPGAHYVYLTPNEDRLVVVTYFLKFGVLTNQDALSVAVFNVNQKVNKAGTAVGPPKVSYDRSFSLNFSPDRPHSVQSLTV